MRFLPAYFLLLLISCHRGPEEKTVAAQLRQNNLSLERQLHLLEKSSSLLLSDMEADNPVRQVCMFRKMLSEETKENISRSRSFEDASSFISRAVLSFNDSLAHYSPLKIVWEPSFPESGNYDLLESWKRNSLLLMELAMLEKCIELAEIRSRFGGEQIRPVIYCPQYTQIRRGNNAIFEIAFKSKKPELVQIRIRKSTHNGNPMPRKEIELDPYTQRFIIHDLRKGKYVIEGYLDMISNTGEKETYPFSERFAVD
jgi:hypothetical protein